jgi:hypothetical protein
VAHDCVSEQIGGALLFSSMFAMMAGIVLAAAQFF